MRRLAAADGFGSLALDRRAALWDLAAQDLISTETLSRCMNGERVQIAGLVLVRQEPRSAKDVRFMTIDDECGVTNLVIWPNGWSATAPQ
ncbi:hypothetical protein [Roseobacter sp. HKCCA0434]|uniref:hypothetical protein n=1 Tax=Roseobacter sp. HKCCA0434 TaxID=3079297 RepID=UPI0029059A13|nr:hypothetical protein [Roseobacter sp. HKCCA0434]